MLALVGRNSIFSFRYFWNRELPRVSFKLSSLSQLRKFAESFYSEANGIEEKNGKNKQENIVGRLSRLLNEKKYDEIGQVVKNLTTEGVNIDPTFCIILAKELARRHRFDELIQVFEYCPKEKRDEIYPFIIRSYGDVKNIEKAQFYFDQVRDRANVWCYAAIMDAHRKVNHQSEVINLFNELKEKKIKPTTGVYTIILHSFSMQKNITQMLHYLSKMQADQLTPDFHVYSLIITALNDANELDRTQAIIDMIQNSDKTPSISAYTAIICALSKRGLPKEMLAIFNEMKERGIKPDYKVYTSVVIGFGRAGDLKNMLFYMKEMREQGFKFDTVIFTSLLSLYLRRQEPNQFQTTLDWMHKENVVLDKWGYDILMRFYCENGNLQMGLQTLNTMKEKKLQLDEYSYSPVIVGCMRKQQNERAMEFYKELLSTGSIPSPYFYSLIIAACNDITLINKLLSDMESMKIPREFYVKGALASVYARSGQFAEVVKLYDKLRESRTPLCNGDLHFFLIALGHFKQTGFSARLVEQLKVLKERLGAQERWKLKNPLGKEENTIFSLLLVTIKRKLAVKG